MKKLILVLILFPQIIEAQKNTYSTTHANLSFEYYKKNLTDLVKSEIDSVWDIMKNGSDAEFHLLSKVELKKLPNDHKYKLSSMRADSVLAYLHRKRIAPKYTQLKTEYFESERKISCASSNASYRSMAPKKGNVSVIVEKDTYSRKYFHKSESSFLSSTCQEFAIYPNEDQYVYGSQGTIVKFPANCFSIQGMGDVNEIEITLCEYYTLGDILLSGLTTSSLERIIETGGTVYIEARYKNKVLHLKTDKPVEIFFPSKSDELKKGMESFEGKSKDGLIDWELARDGNVRKVKEGMKLFEDEDVFLDSLSEWEGSEGIEGYYAETDGYLMKIAKLGFINCDRFYDFPIKTDLLVITDSDVKMSYRLVFEDVKSVLPGYEYSPEGAMKFANLPKGKEAVVIAYSISKNTKQAQFAYKTVKLGEDVKINLTPKMMSISDLQKELSFLF